MNTNPVDRWLVRKAFDQAAPGYEQHAALQREVESRLLERLPLLKLDPDQVLDLGCGTGRGSAALKLQYPGARVIGLDFAPAMLHEARQQSRWRRRLLLLCADLTRMPLAARSIDLIFTNLSLQWCNDLGQAFNEFRRVLRPGGTLLFSTFGPDTLTELRQAWSVVDGRSHVNDFTDLHLVGDALVTAGFQQPVMDSEQLTVTYSSVRQLLNELKGLGAHNLTRQRNHALTGKQRLKAMIDAYQPFRSDDRYPASWEVVYGVARAPAEGQPIRTGEGETASFSVDHLRGGKR